MFLLAVGDWHHRLARGDSKVTQIAVETNAPVQPGARVLRECCRARSIWAKATKWLENENRDRRENKADEPFTTTAVVVEVGKAAQ